MTDVAEAVAEVSRTQIEEARPEQVSTVGPTLGPILVLRMRPPAKMSTKQFFAFCKQNPEMQIERTAEGDIIIMPPASPESSDRNADLTYQLRGWAKRNGTGVAYDATAGFTLP